MLFSFIGKTVIFCFVLFDFVCKPVVFRLVCLDLGGKAVIICFVCFTCFRFFHGGDDLFRFLRGQLAGFHKFENFQYLFFVIHGVSPLILTYG